jgi:hypothetical protein
MYRTRVDEAYRGDMDRLGGTSSMDAHWTDRALDRRQPSPYPFTRISSPPAAAANDDTSDGNSSDDHSTGSSGRSGRGDAARDDGKKHQRWANPIIVRTRAGPEDDEDTVGTGAEQPQTQQSAPSITPRERTLPPQIDVSSHCCRLYCVVLRHRNARPC